VKGGGFYRCGFCRFDTMHSHEAIAHIKNTHGIDAK
jgi:hypothetical protein